MFIARMCDPSENYLIVAKTYIKLWSQDMNSKLTLDMMGMEC